MTPLLEVEGLTVTVATAEGPLLAVRDVSYSIGSGETVCVVGESGCGKSMTALAIMGLLPRSAHRAARVLRFEGQDLLRAPAVIANLRGRRIGMIFQEPMTALNPVYTVGEQIAEGIVRHLGRSRTGALARAVELLALAGVPNPERRIIQYPHQLSGGLRQRVMIAIALSCDPALIIADEPTTALDVTVQAQILRLLSDLQQKLGVSILLITHDLAVVAQMARRVLVMYAGEVVEAGTVGAILTEPRHPYTAALLRCIPTHASRAAGEQLGTIPGIVPTLFASPKGCAFAARCDKALPECATAPAPVVTLTRHEYRCVRS